MWVVRVKYDGLEYVRATEAKREVGAKWHVAIGLGEELGVRAEDVLKESEWVEIKEVG